MQEFYRLKISSLDAYSTPVARVDAAGTITYVNRAAQQLLGIAQDQRVHLSTLFPDSAELARVTAQLHARLEGELSNYKTTVHRPGAPASSPAVPIRVYAFPDLDDEGEVTGSVAIIHDRSEESMRAAIHAAIEQSTTTDALFDVVAAQLRRRFQFDVFRISAISKSRKHMRSLYSTDPNAKTDYPFRWWPMPAFVERELDDLSARTIDIETMFSQPEYARLAETDAATANYLKAGYQSVFNMPVTENGRLTAIIAFDSKARHAFDHLHHEDLLALPLGQAVITALYRERRRQDEAVYATLRSAATYTHDVKCVARELVLELVKQGWDHASIFQADEARNRMRLVCQANGADETPLPEPFELPRLRQDGAPANAVARAAVTNRRVKRFNSRANGPFGQDGRAPAGSELVVPILSRNKRGRPIVEAHQRERWVLNVESRKRGSFADEEIKLLELLAGEANGVLHRSSMFELQVAVLGAVNDAVIETDERGIIRWSNAAARHMLGLPDKFDPDKPLPFRRLAGDARTRDALANQDCLDHRELTLRTLHGKLVPVLLSISTLPEHLGGKVHVVSDFTYQKEVQRLGELKEVFRHAALEGRIPLSLATMWLRQYAEQTPGIEDMVEKVMAQLGRADLPLERLLRLFSQESTPSVKPYCDLGRAVQTTLAELPETARQAIRANVKDAALPVSIDFTDLQFCVESLISFGLRTQPQSKPLNVCAELSDRHVHCRVWGDWRADFTGSGGGGGSTERWRRKSLSDLTLGDSVIRRLVSRAGGSYRRSFGPALSFDIALPLFA